MTSFEPGAEIWRSMLTSICQTLDIPAPANERLQVTGQEALPSCYPVTDLAVASIGAACFTSSPIAPSAPSA